MVRDRLRDSPFAAEPRARVVLSGGASQLTGTVELAARIRDESREALAIRWIVPWKAATFGVNDEQFAEIKRVLALGYPVAAGSGHSRLLVGYRDDDKAAGGGVFITEDSALNRFDEVTYEFVRTKVADVFWVEALQPPASKS